MRWEWRAATHYAREAAEIISQRPGVEKTEVLRAWVTEAAALNRRERFSHAARILREALEYLDITCHEERYAYGITLRHLTTALHGQGRRAEAEALAWRAFEILCSVPLHKENHQIAEAWRVLEDILRDQGWANQAKELVRKAYHQFIARPMETVENGESEVGEFKTEKPWP